MFLVVDRRESRRQNRGVIRVNKWRFDRCLLGKWHMHPITDGIVDIIHDSHVGKAKIFYARPDLVERSRRVEIDSKAMNNQDQVFDYVADIGEVTPFIRISTMQHRGYTVGIRVWFIDYSPFDMSDGLRLIGCS